MFACRQLNRVIHGLAPIQMKVILHEYTLFQRKASYYANTPMQYTAIFYGCKNVNFQIKNYNIFLTIAQNIDCGHTLD